VVITSVCMRRMCSGCTDVGTGLGRFQRGQRFLVGQVGAAQGAAGDVAQALLFDADRTVPGGVGHDRDRHRSGQQGQRGAADDDAQAAHGRGSSRAGRAGRMVGPVLGQVRLSEHGAGPGGMGSIRYSVTL
jgi:hypothetical protein